MLHICVYIYTPVCVYIYIYMCVYVYVTMTKIIAKPRGKEHRKNCRIFCFLRCMVGTQMFAIRLIIPYSFVLITIRRNKSELQK